MQEPLGRPPNKEHTDPGAQIPASPLEDVQASKLDNEQEFDWPNWQKVSMYWPGGIAIVDDPGVD